MKRLWMILGLSSLLHGCSSAQPAVNGGGYQFMLQTLLSHSVPEVGVPEAADRQEDAVFLDAREPAEYEVSHIEGARHVGYDHFDLNSLADIPKDREVVVYCSVGYRSEKVSEQLIEAGYTKVVNLYGGIFEWKNQGREVVDSSGQATERVHAFDRKWGIWLKEGERVY